MEISINSISQSVSTYQTANITSKEQQQEKQIIKETSPDNLQNTTSAHGDTLTISEAGKSASANMNYESSANSEENNNTGDLSGYSDSELKQMYLNGTITKSEYDEELASRE